jgi:hypothetical protein
MRGALRGVKWQRCPLPGVALSLMACNAETHAANGCFSYFAAYHTATLSDS